MSTGPSTGEEVYHTRASGRLRAMNPGFRSADLLVPWPPF